MKLTMETVSKCAGFSRDPDARVFVCDQCKHQYKTFDDPDLHEGKACPWCGGGAYTERYKPGETVKNQYIKIKLHGGNSCVQPRSELANAIDGELDAVSQGEKVTITFESVEMTDEEYQNLPEFTGH